MGSQKFPGKKYEGPLHPWREDRIKSERELIKKYGLKNHKEVWKAKTFLRKRRTQARALLAKVGAATPQSKKESEQLLLNMTKMGVLPMGCSLDDVLALETEAILSRRLQTLVYLKGFSSTPYQARQLINHGHIGIGDRKITVPGYMVHKDEEGLITYTLRSPLNEISHPARPKRDMYRGEGAPAVKPETPVEKPLKAEEPAKPVLKEEKAEPKKETPEEQTQPDTPKEPVTEKTAHEKKHETPKESKKKETKEGA